MSPRDQLMMYTILVYLYTKAGVFNCFENAYAMEEIGCLFMETLKGKYQ